MRKDRPMVDVLVAGGGPAGTAAAIAAARKGLRTLLVESNGCLGGTATAGALPFYLGMFNGSIPFRKMLEKNLAYRDLPRPRQAVGGIFQEVVDRLKAENSGVGPCKLAQTDAYPGLDRLGCHDEFTFDLEAGKRVLEEMALEAGVELLYYTQAAEVEADGPRVRGVVLANKDGLTFQPARVFIDCTGDADLAYRGGFETYKGDRETGEMTAASLVAHLENIDPGPLEKYLNEGGDPWFPDACAKARAAHPDHDLPEHLIIFPMTQPGVFMVNGGTSFMGYDGTSARSMTDLTLRGRRRARLLVEELFRPLIPGAEHCTLRLTAAYPGIRETRRIVAEYELSENDLLTGRDFADTIALAGRHFDLGRKGGQPFHQQNLSVKNGMTQIPYRSLVPRGSDNLIVAGRCIAAQGQALGPARIMSTCYALGQAAGCAAALKLESGDMFARLDVQALRARLRCDGAVLDEGGTHGKRIVSG